MQEGACSEVAGQAFWHCRCVASQSVGVGSGSTGGAAWLQLLYVSVQSLRHSSREGCAVPQVSSEWKPWYRSTASAVLVEPPPEPAFPAVLLEPPPLPPEPAFPLTPPLPPSESEHAAV